MKKAMQDRNTRIIHRFSDKQKERYPKDQPLKDKIYYCRSRREVIELFDSMLVTLGETLTLQTLVDVKDNGTPEWVNQEVKTTNKNKPKAAFQEEYVPVKEPKKQGWY